MCRGLVSFVRVEVCYRNHILHNFVWVAHAIGHTPGVLVTGRIDVFHSSCVTVWTQSEADLVQQCVRPCVIVNVGH